MAHRLRKPINIVALVLAATAGSVFWFTQSAEWFGVEWASQAAAETPTPQTEQTRPKPPPLSLDGLLDEKLPEAMPDEKPQADNFACFVCHGNYDGEELATVHAREGHGCVKCHGVSHGHRNDEDHLTPPDIMYPAAKIEPACAECHETHDAPARKVIARWQERAAGTPAEKLVCTDCHGQHRLQRRTVRWDKATGKLLKRVEETASQIRGPEAAGARPGAGAP